ncbi:MAG: phosphoenolpyruvate synthase [Candidatus Thiodiazotropha sp. (ex Monitilora ramsayi)]|nr:phosphoenolpyruvate synthase [Candidatus Thiodiazotropha sp. (ex Monitilora ramsayi)]
MQYILNRADKIDLSRFGGKAAALGHLAAAKLPIPDWLVIEPEAFYQSLGPQLFNELQEKKDAADIQSLLAEIKPHAELLAELEERLAKLSPNGERVAVRSSAVDEDGADHSFAGQLESYLYVPLEQVAERVVDVWRSGFSERVLTYRIEAGLPALPPASAVLVQRMVASDHAGVAFSADPVSGRRNIAVVSAVHGLGTALVSGDADADTWRVDGLETIIDRQVAEKRIAHRFDPDAPDNLREEPLQGEMIGQPVLTDDDVKRVAKLAREVSRHFGKPQDIEWAFDKGELYLLQSRPITALNALPDPTGERNLWDNSNIAESYGGITTPLTFSFARRAYESVYREFCRVLRVPASVIQDNDTTFKRMLGLIRGRVYYNLLSWYRVLALLPGFTVNRRFMEQMMGVKEGLPEEIAKELSGSTADRFRDALRLGASVGGLLLNHFLLPYKNRRFYKRLEAALESQTNLTGLNATQLAGHYHDLERKLLTRWDAPLINDFFAMIFYGVLRSLGAKWCHDSDESLQNDLLAGEGGMISAEPAQRVRQMAEIIREDQTFSELLTTGDLTEIEVALPEQTAFHQAYLAYLDKFGDRCLDELKLESATLHDDPLLLLRSIGQFALRLREQKATEPGSIEREIRQKAETRVTTALENHAVRGAVYRWVLKHTRARVRDRENLRFERTRLFGRVRRVFVELGKRLYAEGLLDHPRDVFHLEVNEVVGFVEGTTVTTDLKGLVELRREEFAGYESMAPPVDRFETLGMVHQGNDFTAPEQAEELTDGDLKGIGCCPGVVRGPVRVISDPRNAVLNAGEILVAERTDPGWIMLFPAASGILVERGSLLSHSAIVAREMGIPAVVSVPGITRTLSDGEWVEFDGSSGVIRRVEPDRETVDA